MAMFKFATNDLSGGIFLVCEILGMKFRLVKGRVAIFSSFSSFFFFFFFFYKNENTNFDIVFFVGRGGGLWGPEERRESKKMMWEGFSSWYATFYACSIHPAEYCMFHLSIILSIYLSISLCLCIYASYARDVERSSNSWSL